MIVLLPTLQALKYVSFPVQTLAKCAKMIPVMVSQTLYYLVIITFKYFVTIYKISYLASNY